MRMHSSSGRSLTHRKYSIERFSLRNSDKDTFMEVQILTLIVFPFKTLMLGKLYT